MFTLESRTLRLFGIAVLFSAFMLAVFGGSSIGPGNNIQTASADATNVYLKFSDDHLTIQGDSLDKAHPGEVVATSYDEKLDIPVNIGSGAGGVSVGVATSSEFSFTKRQDKASIPLIKAAAKGAKLDNVIITFQKVVAGVPKDVYQVNLKYFFVSSVRQTVTSGDGITEVVTFKAAQVTWRNLTTGDQFGWDFEYNRPL